MAITYLAHHGVIGQKWGERNYQNPDGSLTPEGYEHYYGKSKGSRPHSRTRNIKNAKVKVEKKELTDSTKSINRVDYAPGDSDFNDENLKEENRIGDTDFFITQKSDGSIVLIEEDSKWVLPKGTDISKVKSSITAFSNWVEKERSNGNKVDSTSWTKNLNKALKGSTNFTNIKLSHSGILGQKWGVRRYQNEDGTYTEEGKARRRSDYSEDYKEYKRLGKKTIKQMSNNELRDYNKRAQLELDYNRLKANSSLISKGAAYIAAASGIVFTVTNFGNAISAGKKLINTIISNGKYKQLSLF